MSTQAHTPGPWLACPRPADDRERFSHWVCEQDDPGHNVGICLCETRPDSEANARLIAATPDLLAALKMLLNHAMTQISEAVEQPIRAAIAKAEGRS